MPTPLPTFHFNATLERDSGVEVFRVAVRYLPGTPDTMPTLSDPGHPGDPPEAELLKVWQPDDPEEKDIMPSLSEKELSHLIDAAYEFGEVSGNLDLRSSFDYTLPQHEDDDPPEDLE